MTSSRVTCSSVSVSGRRSTTWNFVGQPRSAGVKSHSTSSPVTSQPLRAAYISVVTATQPASEAASSSSGLGPSSAPPASVCSSMVSSWRPMRTLWRYPDWRVTVAFMAPSILRPHQRRYASGLNSSPVGTFGVKNVDFGGMFTPAAATSPIWPTPAPGRKNAAS